MVQLNNIIGERLKKRDALKEQNINPYPAQVKRSHTIKAALDDFDSLTEKKKKVHLVGRILLMRPYGAITFMKVADGTGEIQFLFRKDVISGGEETLLLNLDLGDFISGEGLLTLSKSGERTLEVENFGIAVKALRPLPDKWHGIADVEERFRRRYLDLLMNKDVKDRFTLRSRVLNIIREQFTKDGFLEVETPILQNVPAGAAAKPFRTHLSALDIPLYLRIAPELYLKELLVGGFDKVFEMGRLFRNEGMDATHNPEFTSVEGYWAYQDAQGLMEYLENFVMKVLDHSGIGRSTKFRDHTIKWESPIPRKTFNGLVQEYAKIDLAQANIETMEEVLIRSGHEVPAIKTEGELCEAIFKKMCLPKLIQPVFVTEHPLALSPLAKKKDDAEVADRFQLVVGGIEIINAYSELNDPEEQRERFERSEEDISKGSAEAQFGDEDYVEALEYGMPPAAGFGIGIDRLIMLLTDSHNIREVILFPTMRPKKAGE
ncbi:MAG: Lysine-tRNA ligase [Parcubacteria group bacterium GW2011_GWA2_40_8]|nr:MAG: Lysine-tRNA ligase [Parcubacteria group bacterium GW2011_GWA2_40_8]